MPASLETRDPLLHTKIGSWTILEIIGGGGMGTVYLAKNLEIDVQVAVKVMKLDVIAPANRASAVQAGLKLARERFLREAKILAQLGKNDPGIVQILDYGHLPDGRPYMVMEYLYGRSFDKWLEQGLPAFCEVRRWLAQLCDALASIHDAGVVHRDLKPENIWIAEPKTGPSSLKLIDFGISKAAANATLTKTGEFAGSPGYMAPERISDSPGDARSDIYAFGVLLYEIVTGRLPFTADSLVALAVKIKHDLPPVLAPRADFEVTDELERLVYDCLAKEPAKRPQSALDLKQRLLRAFPGESECSPHPTRCASRPLPAARGEVSPRGEASGPAARGEVSGTAVYVAALARSSRRRTITTLLLALALAGAGYALWKWPDRRVATKPATTSAAPALPTSPAPSKPDPASAPPPVPTAAAQTAPGPSAARPRDRVRVAHAPGRKLPPNETSSPSSQLEPQATLPPETPTPSQSATSSIPARAPQPAPMLPVPAAGEPLEWIPKRTSRSPSPSERDLITDEKTLIGK